MSPDDRVALTPAGYRLADKLETIATLRRELADERQLVARLRQRLEDAETRALASAVIRADAVSRLREYTTELPWWYSVVD